MDIEKVIQIVLGAVVAYVILLQVKFRKSESKLNVSEEKNAENKIDREVHALSDDELDALVSKDIGPGKPNP